MEKNLTIKTSLLNVQSTHSNVEKDQEMYFFGKRNLPFCGRSNQMGNNCCDTVPVAHVNTASVLVSGSWDCMYFIYGNNFNQNGGCFGTSRLFMEEL